MGKDRVGFDEIGYWSEVKLEILKEYAQAYSRILTAQKKPRFTHVYIDAFAGPGVHIAKSTGALVAGSPLNALSLNPPFKEYHFIDLDNAKVEALKQISGRRADVQVYEGDCNQILRDKVFPRVQWSDYRRGLCLLDPYGLHLNWHVLQEAGSMRTLDVFLNFPVMDMNRNVLWANPTGVSDEDIARMTAFWGDESWRDTAYIRSPGLFGPIEEKAPNEVVAAGFRKRLQDIAGFKHVPEPLPMRNSKGAVVYYLFFASQKPVAEHIVLDLFNKYRTYGAR